MVMSRTSTAFIVMMTVHLLRRSAKKPDTTDVRISGKVKTTMARVVWACEAVSSSCPGDRVAVAALIPRSATMNFQALSLKAPQNCAVSSPRNGRRPACEESGCGSMGISFQRIYQVGLESEVLVCRNSRNDAIIYPVYRRGI